MDWIPLVTSFALGALASAVAGIPFYLKSGNQLKTEAAEMKRLTLNVLRALEAAGLVELARDKNGQLTGGLVVKVSAHITGASSVGADLGSDSSAK